MTAEFSVFDRKNSLFARFLYPPTGIKIVSLHLMKGMKIINMKE